MLNLRPVNETSKIHHMQRLLNIALLITFLFVYLDWFHDGAGFIWQVESSMFSELHFHIGLLANAVFLLFILTFIGQALLIVGAIKAHYSKRVTICAVILLNPIVVLVLIMGLLIPDIKIALSTAPFLILVAIFIIKGRNMRITKEDQENSIE
jgi:hypothetical protein